MTATDAQLDRMVFAAPATVRFAAAVGEGLPPFDREVLLTRAREIAIDPEAVDDPFFFRAEISNSRLDAYFTIMAESTLRNFAADATAGVAFQNSHRTWELGFGRSLFGHYLPGATETDPARTLADFVVYRDMNLNGVNTDDLIRALSTGVVSDVSVGFSLGTDGQFRCSICGRDMLRDWDCHHVPGLTYELRDGEGDVVVRQMAVAHIENCRLNETSVVYDGATPHAGVLKAEQEARAGRLTDRERALLERQYRCALPDRDARSVIPLIEPSPMERKDTAVVDDQSHPTPTDDQHEVRLDLPRMSAALGDYLPHESDGPVDYAAAVERMAADLAAMRDLAEAGREYRETLLETAAKEAVRAGLKLNVRVLLERADLATIKATIGDLAAQGDARFPGGRASRETSPTHEDDSPAPATRVVEPPASAFAG